MATKREGIKLEKEYLDWKDNPTMRAWHPDRLNARSKYTISETNNDLNKPWQFEEDGLTVTRTSPWSPPGCHPVGCTLKCYTDKNGRLVKVEGDENNPVTQGRLCARCITLKDYIYNPSRILHPMKRDPKERGNADAWEQISWDEAFDIIKREYDRITAQYGRESIVCFVGTGREGGTMAPFGSRMLCTPNFCYTQSGYACYVPRMAASSYLLGVAYPEIDYAGGLPGRYDDPEYEIPECVVVWGKDPLPSNPDGLFGHALIDLMRRGTRLIVVDPRSNWLSTRADYALKLRPGTDGALAMAWLNVIISEDLYDHEFVEYWCYGFDELAERVSEMTPDKAAEITGVPAQMIVESARMYAEATPASISWGLALDQKANGMQVGHCLIALMAICGNIDVPGGIRIGDKTMGLNEAGFGFEEGLGKDLVQKMIGANEYPAYCGLILNSHCDLTLRAMETGDPYPIKMGFYGGNNLLSCTSAEPQRWMKAINNTMEFVIAFDTFMTPSAQATCDIFLPLAAAAEREGVVQTHYGSSPVTMGFMNEVLRHGEGMSDMELCFNLGKVLNPHLWEQYDEVRDFIEHLRLGKKYRYEDIRKEVVLQRYVGYRKYETGLLRRDGKPGFNTSTGRVELWSYAFHQFGDQPLPYYEEPQYSPASTPELLEKYPFVLTTGARTYAFFHSENRQIPYCRELNPDPLLEINPDDAKAAKVADGQWVKVSNQFGEALLKAKVSQIVKPGVVHAQHGWWFPEQDENAPNLYGTFRSNINNLVPNFHFGKMGFGAPFKCLLCNVEPVSENYDTDMELVWDKFGKLV